MNQTASAIVTIMNKRGLHARASAKFVEMAASFRSEITVTKDGNTVSGRSIMGLMMLAASLGKSVKIDASGPDAKAAVNALVELVAAKFQEDA